MHSSKLHTKGKYWTAEDGFRHCEEIARHYENFPVASRFIRKDMRKYVWAIYAFARTADDYADEPGYTLAERIDNLNRWDQYLEECYNGNPTHRVFAALAATVDRFQLPIDLFRNLLTAFRADITVNRYETFEDLLGYCRNSANPIGRLVLMIFNYRSERMMELSDHICTALQLTNFLQDVSVDLQKNRIYIPLEDLQEFHYSEQDLLDRKFNAAFSNLIAFQLRRTAEFFMDGKPLLTMVDTDLSRELHLTWNGGTRILRKIHELKYNVLARRPSLSVWDKLGLLFGSTKS